MAAMNELTSLKCQKYFTGAPYVVLNSVYSIGTKHIYVAKNKEDAKRV